MTTHCYLQSSSPSRTRRLVGLGLTALITTGVVGAASASAAPNASAAPLRTCYLDRGFDNGIVMATRSQGHCPIPAGTFVHNVTGTPGFWAANIPTPDGNGVLVGVYNNYGLPEVSLPHP